MTAHNNTTRLDVGTRVHQRGQQYSTALEHGTATIIEVVKQHPVDGTWEYLVSTDTGGIESWNIVGTPSGPLEKSRGVNDSSRRVQ